MKKALLLSLVLMFTLVGCSSTSPALKDAWLNEAIADSSESKTIVKLEFEVNEEQMEDLDEYAQKMISLLKNGIVIEQKTTKDQNSYLKIGFVDSTPIKESEFWKSEREPYIEFFIKDDIIYARTSSEDRLIRIEQSAPEFRNIFYSGQVLTNEERADLKEFFAGELKKYLSQFDFKIRNIKDRGFINYTTPDGKQRVKQIHFEMTIDDMISFYAYLFGNLAEYDGFKSLIRELDDKVLQGQIADETDEELDQAIAELRAELFRAKVMLEEYNEQKIEEELGLNIDYLLQSDLYITTKAETIGSNTVLDLNVSETSTEEFLKIKLTIDTQRWNVNKNVSLPGEDFENSLSIEDLNDREKIQQLGEQSIIRSIMEEKLRRKGRLTIGEELAKVKDDYVFLDEAPYISESGNAMVPVKIISGIAETEAKWNKDKNEVAFTVDGNEVIIKIGSKTALVNGEPFEMPEAAIIKNGSTFVPLRFVSEKLGAKVNWEPEAQRIDIEFE